MALSCGCDYIGGDEPWWECSPTQEFLPLETKNRRRCVNCKQLIEIGALHIPVDRYRPPYSDVEENIHGDQVKMADWHLCEECGGLLLSILEKGFCCTLGNETLQNQIRDYNDDY